jgi:hypothetical protein
MGFEILGLAEQLPKMIGEDQFRSQQFIQHPDIGMQHCNP